MLLPLLPELLDVPASLPELLPLLLHAAAERAALETTARMVTLAFTF
jgi:hypothetical protein